MEARRFFRKTVVCDSLVFCSALIIGFSFGNVTPSSLPSFSSGPQRITTLEGQMVQFECVVKNLQSWQELVWRYSKVGEMDEVMALGGSVLTRKERVSVEEKEEKDGKRSVFIIRLATTAEDGHYICAIAGSRLNQINELIVNVPATIVAVEPEETPVNVLLGHPINLSCSAQGKPVPIITWKKQGSEDRTGERLSIESASREDSGWYNCLADNGAGNPTERRFKVNVQYGPTVQSSVSSLLVGLGQTVELDCAFDSNPPPEVTWYHNGVTPTSNRSNLIISTDETDDSLITLKLKLSEISRGDVGDYECRARNAIGRVSHIISVNGLPRDLKIESPGFSPYSDQYTVRWSVRTESPVVESQLTIQLDEGFGTTSDFNSSEMNSVKELIVSTSPDETTPLRSQEFILKKLQPSSRYAVTMRVRNAFGFTNWTEMVHFETAEEGNEAPLWTTAKPTQLGRHSPDDADNPRYTHLHDVNGANGNGLMDFIFPRFSFPLIVTFSVILTRGFDCWIIQL